MPRPRSNPQWFALPARPPERVSVAGATCRLARVFKHDFFAATCEYVAEGPARIDRIVVKFARRQGFCGLPLAWLGRWLAAREEAIYRTLDGVDGVPRWVGRVGDAAYAIEYVPGRPLDHDPPPPEGFFDRLRDVFDAVHARGVGYGDANKRSNVLIGPDGRPFLIDYQISLRKRPDLPPPLRNLIAAVVDRLAAKDLYHLYKHKRRMRPGELTAEEEALSRRRGGLHLLHRKLTKPYRALRRKFLARRHADGRLASPTRDIEDHHQPEKDTWRGNGGG